MESSTGWCFGRHSKILHNWIYCNPRKSKELPRYPPRLDRMPLHYVLENPQRVCSQAKSWVNAWFGDKGKWYWKGIDIALEGSYYWYSVINWMVLRLYDFALCFASDIADQEAQSAATRYCWCQPTNTNHALLSQDLLLLLLARQQCSIKYRLRGQVWRTKQCTSRK